MDQPKLTLVNGALAAKSPGMRKCHASGCESRERADPSKDCWINSAAHDFCFWQYVREKSDTDGTMKELVQSELAALFGWSNTKVHFMLKEAMQDLADALKLHGAEELLEDFGPSETDDAVAIPNDFTSDALE